MLIVNGDCRYVDNRRGYRQLPTGRTTTTSKYITVTLNVLALGIKLRLKKLYVIVHTNLFYYLLFTTI